MPTLESPSQGSREPPGQHRPIVEKGKWQGPGLLSLVSLLGKGLLNLYPHGESETRD